MFGDLPWEFYNVNSFQDDVVCPHWIRGSERRADGKKKIESDKVHDLRIIINT